MAAAGKFSGGNRERGLRARHFVVVLLLVAAPGFAAWRVLGRVGAGYLAGWCSALSVFAYLIFARDKRSARDNDRREPEFMLHLVEFAGGWPGAFLAQQGLRHKSSKRGYQLVFWLIVLSYECVAIEALLGWPVTRRLVGGQR